MASLKSKKHNFGEITGTCKICGINLWSAANSKPVVFPCNVLNCPYEDEELQNRNEGFEKFSSTGSGLGQIDF